MHESVMAFGQRVITSEDVRGKRVIEVGSMNVNGSLRAFVESLQPTSYIGVDGLPGTSVDRVCDATELAKHFGKKVFDVVLSTEMLEHAQDWRGAVTNMKHVLVPGGLLILTARSPGFQLHGYPYDWHRFTLDDMRRIFSDFDLEVLETDPQAPGVMLRARKPEHHSDADLTAIHVAAAPLS